MLYPHPEIAAVTAFAKGFGPAPNEFGVHVGIAYIIGFTEASA